MNIYNSLYTVSNSSRYLKRYIQFISSRKKDKQIKEKHHILPRSLFPAFEKVKENIIDLSPKEHYIAHLLLMKAFPDSAEMKFAFYCMCNGWQGPNQYRKYKINAKLYAETKLLLADIRSVRMSADNPYTKPHIKELIVERHGGLGFGSDSILAKYKDTMIEKFGVDNIFKHSEFIKENALRSKKRWENEEYKTKTKLAISHARKGQHVIRCSCLCCHRLIQANNITNHYRWSHP